MEYIKLIIDGNDVKIESNVPTHTIVQRLRSITIRLENKSWESLEEN